MVVGALLDLGLNPQELERELHKLLLEGYRLKVDKVSKAGLQATSFRVLLTGTGNARPVGADYSEIETPVRVDLPEKEGRQPGFPHRDLSAILE